MKDYYIISGRKRYQVKKEVYSSINQLTNRIHYLCDIADQCHTSEKARSRCEGDCSACWYYVSQEAQIDDPVTLNRIELASPTLVEDEVYCAGILDVMQEADPDGRRIGRLYLLHCQDVDIAQILGITKSAYYRRKAKIKAHLRKYLAQDNI